MSTLKEYRVWEERFYVFSGFFIGQNLSINMQFLWMLVQYGLRRLVTLATWVPET